MKKHAWLILVLITVAAGLALSLANLVTEGPIARQKLLASNAARAAVYPDADNFAELTAAEDSKIDSVYTAMRNGEAIGYVLQTTVSGYGGPIEIVLGVDNAGAITGISVGGSNFAETAGLGTRTRDPEFTDQFVGLSATPALGSNIDAISGATISSTAVVNGAARCYRYYLELTGQAGGTEQWQEETPEDAETAATAVTGATENEPESSVEIVTLAQPDENGAVKLVTETVMNYQKLMDVIVGLDENGSIVSLVIEGVDDAESMYYGTSWHDGTFFTQFIGKSGVLAYGADVDALTGATITSNAVLAAVNDALMR